MKNKLPERIVCRFKAGQTVWLAGNGLITRQLVTFIKPSHTPAAGHAHIRLRDGEYHCVPLCELVNYYSQEEANA